VYVLTLLLDWRNPRVVRVVVSSTGCSESVSVEI
jgi:hypothetical protein